MNGYYRSISRCHSFEPVRVEGRVPDSVRGTLYRNGPALFEHGGGATGICLKAMARCARCGLWIRASSARISFTRRRD